MGNCPENEPGSDDPSICQPSATDWQWMQRVNELEVKCDRLRAAVCQCGDHCQAPGALCATCAEELRTQRDDLRRQLNIDMVVIHDMKARLIAEEERHMETARALDELVAERGDTL